MNCVCYFCHDRKKSDSESDTLIRYLSSFFSVFEVKCDSADLTSITNNYSSTDELVFVSACSFTKIHTENCVLVFPEGIGAMPNEFICDNAVAVVFSSDNCAANPLNSHDIALITCGVSSKDTLTYSSHAGNSLLVSLQRSVTALNGTIYEPFEAVVKLNSPDDLSSAMACFAVRLSLGTL